MRTIRFAFVFCALLAGPATPTLADDVSDNLKALEEKVWEAWKAGDKQAYGALTAEPAVKVSSAGIVTGKDGFVSIEIPENCADRNFALDSMQVHKITDTVYALTYAAQLTQTCDDVPADQTLFTTSVWANQGGEWKTVLLSEAEVPVPAVD